MKKRIYLFSITVLFILVGCSDKPNNDLFLIEVEDRLYDYHSFREVSINLLQESYEKEFGLDENMSYCIVEYEKIQEIIQLQRESSKINLSLINNLILEYQTSIKTKNIEVLQIRIDKIKKMSKLIVNEVEGLLMLKLLDNELSMYQLRIMSKLYEKRMKTPSLD